MQISFLKDLATPRDPTSRFTFLNYLKEVGRLDWFINLGTFLPSREEYEDYLRWCARHFERMGWVRYGLEVGKGGVMVGERGRDERVKGWEVVGTEVSSGREMRMRARNVVVAVGGRANIPRVFSGLMGVVHSSAAASAISRIEEIRRLSESRSDGSGRKLQLAVIGGGQSAAEIFNDLWDRFPDAEVKLILRDRCLRPSDDSPL